MSKLTIVLAASVALLTTAACATRQTSEASETVTLSKPILTNTPRESSAVAEVRGETASAYGDDQTAVKLYERSLAERPSALNEFNLAAAYSRTGRPKEAIELYKRAVGDGTNQTAIGSNRINGKDTDVRFNISDEARLRIALVEASLSPGGKDAINLSNAQALRMDTAVPSN